MSKPDRSEAVVLEELEQTMGSVVEREKELKKAITTLESSKKQLASKEKELHLQNQEVQEQVDSLMQEFKNIKKRQSALAGQEKRARTEAFSAMVQEAEKELADVTNAIEARTEEYHEIDEKVRELREKKWLLTNIAKADHKISLIQLVKSNLSNLSEATSENSQDQEVIDKIVQNLNRKTTDDREIFLDDLIEQEERNLKENLRGTEETRESLAHFVTLASTEDHTEPEDFLDNLILVGNDNRKEKSREITALEKKENALEANLKELSEVAQFV